MFAYHTNFMINLQKGATSMGRGALSNPRQLRHLRDQLIHSSSAKKKIHLARAHIESLQVRLKRRFNITKVKLNNSLKHCLLFINYLNKLTCIN